MKMVQDMLKMNERFLRYIGKHMSVGSDYYDLENIWLVYDSLKVIVSYSLF